MIDISIIIVTYHNENTIENCINSIIKNIKLNFEIIVIDNSEDNLTYQKIFSFKKDFIKLIKPGKNIGFGKGCNLGSMYASGKYLMFLNPDTILLNDVASILKEHLETNSNCAVVGPQFYDPKKNIVEKTCRTLPDFYTLFLQSTGLEKFSGYYILNKFSHEFPKKVGQIIGACLFVDKKIFEELDKFDEKFFIYFEEVDFCKRVIDKGYNVCFCPTAKVYHYKGVSCENLSTIKNMIFQFRKSRTIYFEKHYGFKGKIIAFLFNKFEGAFKGMCLLLLSLIKKDRFLFEKAKGFFKVLIYV